MGKASFLMAFSGMVVLPAIFLHFYYPSVTKDIVSRISTILPNTLGSGGSRPGSGDGVISPGEKLFTATELAQFDGSSKDKGIYLALLGRVFDVTRGREHYGPGGSYRQFSGRDATRSFVSGDFSAEGLSDDVTGFTSDQLLAVDNWVKFYEKDYKYVGKLVGRYYDSNGIPTPMLQKIQKDVNGERQKELEEEAKRQQFPGCNSEFINGKGGKVWCSKRSGGVERDWVGHPRILFDSSTGQTRCSCIHPSQLNNANLREYTNCPPEAEVCLLPEEGKQ